MAPREESSGCSVLQSCPNGADGVDDHILSPSTHSTTTAPLCDTLSIYKLDINNKKEEEEKKKKEKKSRGGSTEATPKSQQVAL